MVGGRGRGGMEEVGVVKFKGFEGGVWEDLRDFELVGFVWWLWENGFEEDFVEFDDFW